jgi:hypothetical protein
MGFMGGPWGAAACFLLVSGMDPDINYVEVIDKLHALLPQLNQAGIEMCATDLGLALTMLDRARSSDDRATQRRNLANAAHALETVQYHLSKLTLNPEQRREMEARLGELKAKLVDTRAETGQAADPPR